MPWPLSREQARTASWARWFERHVDASLDDVVAGLNKATASPRAAADLVKFAKRPTAAAVQVASRLEGRYDVDCHTTLLNLRLFATASRRVASAANLLAGGVRALADLGADQADALQSRVVFESAMGNTVAADRLANDYAPIIEQSQDALLGFSRSYALAHLRNMHPAFAAELEMSTDELAAWALTTHPDGPFVARELKPVLHLVDPDHSPELHAALRELGQRPELQADKGIGAEPG